MCEPNMTIGEQRATPQDEPKGVVAIERAKHVYRNDAFAELVKDAVRFFNGTPVHPLPLSKRFKGTGIYAIYYTGSADPYSKYAELNRLSYDFPIYVGRAVPTGWRQSRTTNVKGRSSTELYSRLREHARNIEIVDNLKVEDFTCRFMIFEGPSSDMIGTLEAAVIKWKRPLWNTYLDGFGNHDPGKGRYEQAKSDWDVLHPGRSWADKCTGEAPTRESVLAGVEAFLSKVGESNSFSLDLEDSETP